MVNYRLPIHYGFIGIRHKTIAVIASGWYNITSRQVSDVTKEG